MTAHNHTHKKVQVLLPLQTAFVPIITYLSSYRFFIKTCLYFGVVSKISLLLQPFFSIPPVLLVLMTDYTAFLQLVLSTLYTFTLSVQALWKDYRNDILNNELLKTQISTLERQLEITKKDHSLNESRLEAKINDLTSSLEVQKDRNARLLCLTEQLETEKTKNNYSTVYSTIASALSIIVPTINSGISLYLRFTGQSHSEETITLLKTIRAAFEQFQRANIVTRATSRAEGTTPQLTEGIVRDLDD